MAATFPLAGLKVLELGQLIAGPCAARAGARRCDWRLGASARTVDEALAALEGAEVGAGRKNLHGACRAQAALAL